MEQTEVTKTKRTPLVIGVAAVVVAVSVAVINPFKGPLESEQALAAKALKPTVISQIQSDTCKSLKFKVGTIPTKTIKSQTSKLVKVSKLPLVPATKFALVTSWVSTPAIVPDLAKDLPQLAEPFVNAAIVDAYPKLASNWVEYQTKNFSKQLTASESFKTVCSATLKDAAEIDAQFETFEKQRSAFAASVFASGPDADYTTLSPMACREVRVGTGLAGQALYDSGMGPAKASQLLSLASKTFNEVASIAYGSEKDWLQKMSDLSLDVKSYLISGSPADGQLKATQLNNNLGLESQFCSE